jgi:hypothetical protein
LIISFCMRGIFSCGTSTAKNHHVLS